MTHFRLQYTAYAKLYWQLFAEMTISRLKRATPLKLRSPLVWRDFVRDFCYLLLDKFSIMTQTDSYSEVY